LRVIDQRSASHINSGQVAGYGMGVVTDDRWRNLRYFV
jgi:hypothetical protein